MTTETAAGLCPGQTGKYVPWSAGEVFTCDVCGARIRQSHTIKPISPGVPDYDSTYPIPTHGRRATL